MFLYSTAGAVERPSDVGKVLFYTQNGGVVPLEAIASVQETVNTETIRRVNGERTITLSIIPPRDIPLEVGVEKVQREIINDPQMAGSDHGISMRISGASDNLRATRDALSDNFLIAILVSYLYLGRNFFPLGLPALYYANRADWDQWRDRRSMVNEFRRCSTRPVRAIEYPPAIRCHHHARVSRVDRDRRQ